MKVFSSFIKCSFLFFSALFLFACADSSKPKSSGELLSETKNTVSDTSNSVTASSVDSAEPAVAAATDGGVYLVWVKHGAGKSADVYLQKFDAQANPAGEKVRINPQVGEATAWHGDPPTIVVSPANGEIYVGWTARVQSGKKSGTNLFVSVSNDGGKSFNQPAKVNDDSEPASHGMHSLAVNESGKIHAAWLDERNIKMPSHAGVDTNRIETSGEFQYINTNHTPTPETKPTTQQKAETEPNSEIFHAVSGDGAKTFSPNKKISSEVCPCCKTSLLPTAGGKVFVSWRQVLPGDFRHIAVASTSDGGESFSAPTIVSDDRWQINACPVSGAPLATGENGALKTAWFTSGKAGNPGIYAAESSDGGKGFSARTLVSENASSGTPVFLPGTGNNLTIIWEAQEKLFRSKIQANQVGKAEEFAAGSVPAAAISQGKIFVAFTRKEGDKRVVRLISFDDARQQ